MKYSDIALKVVAARESGIIKTNAQFWKTFADRDKFEEEINKDHIIAKTVEKVVKDLDLSDNEIGFICAYDDDFPVINRKVKNNSEKPYLLFYKGDLSLLGDLNNNVAVIGLLDPDEEILNRESKIVERLVKNGLVIVSGLATGCDTIAHRACLAASGKTIAILPTQINNIYPSSNRDLAEEIDNKGGLLLSEYYKEASSKREAINRYIERDRLQAMFAKAVILIASYRKGEGDSGSRHAMEAALKYEVERYVMYNSQTDVNNPRFGLNKDLVGKESLNQVKILQGSSIDYIKTLKNPDLFCDMNFIDEEQEQLDFLKNV